MQAEEEARMYVVRELMRLGMAGMERYAALLASTPANRVIDGLDPWAFPLAPEKAVGFCSGALGRAVLPFAQAIGEDMMACFETVLSATPAVVVIDPWAHDKAHVVLAELPDFDAWLVYAEQVSREVRAREQEEADDE